MAAANEDALTIGKAIADALSQQWSPAYLDSVSRGEQKLMHHQMGLGHLDDIVADKVWALHGI